MVSVSSNTLRPIEDPFGDNSSLNEPPPPYRPCSLPPPSFTTERASGRWSGGGPPSFTTNSLRSAGPPSFSSGSSLIEREREREGGGGAWMGSRAHLIERSPFDDPDDGDGDDGVSELSGPTHGRVGDGSGDAMSAVSNLSYQRETFDEFTRRGFS